MKREKKLKAQQILECYKGCYTQKRRYLAGGARFIGDWFVSIKTGHAFAFAPEHVLS
jgi:hypothetical protein